MLTIEFFQHLAPGKPYGCIVHAPLDAPDDWDTQYEVWQFDKTGDVPPPPGYEDWDMEAALEDLEREQQRVEELICQRNEELVRRGWGGEVLFERKPLAKTANTNSFHSQMTEPMDCRRKIILDYAKWTARSATRNLSKDYVYPLLDKVKFDDVLKPNVVISVEKFNDWHKIETETLCARASDLPIGWGAKLINIYLKTAAYVGDLGSKGLRDTLHPPIDKYLWEGLEERFGKASDICKDACCVKRIKHIENYDETYLGIIRGCKNAAQKLGCRLIEVEQLWRGAET